jgi:hypothetical protein
MNIFSGFKWEELERVVITQKTWEDRPLWPGTYVQG